MHLYMKIDQNRRQIQGFGNGGWAQVKDIIGFLFADMQNENQEGGLPRGSAYEKCDD